MTEEIALLTRAALKLPTAVLFLRIRSGLSVKEAAKAAGIRPSAWRKLVARKILDENVLAQIAAGLGSDPETLVSLAITLTIIEDLHNAPFDPQNVRSRIRRLVGEMARKSAHLEACLEYLYADNAAKLAARLARPAEGEEEEGEEEAPVGD